MESSDRFARASARINLEQCRKQAKDLVKAFKRSDERALRTVRANHPRFRGKTHAEFLRQEHAAHAIRHQVAVDLRPKVPPGVLEPLQDLEPAVVGERPHGRCDRHIANKPSNE